jgi:hypothetical protein
MKIAIYFCETRAAAEIEEAHKRSHEKKRSEKIGKIGVIFPYIPKKKLNVFSFFPFLIFHALQ